MANEYAVNQADLTAVADAIRSKGGTTGKLVFPGGFVSAVSAIQTGTGGGVTVQKKEGICTTNSDGMASVSDIGFQPDVLAFDGGLNSNGEYSFAGVLFSEASMESLCLVLPPADFTKHHYAYLSITRKTSGFEMNAFNMGYDENVTANSNGTFSYVAIKYT